MLIFLSLTANIQSSIISKNCGELNEDQDT